MATLTTTPAAPQIGDVVAINGDGYTPSASVTVAIPELGVKVEIDADAAGAWGTSDVADHAVVTLTSDGVNVTAADTVTIGAVTYTFRAAVTTTANEVKIGADAATTLANLKKAINATGTGGTEYGSLTVIHPTVAALTLTATTLLLAAKTGGTAGNSLASTEASTHLSFGTTTFIGGTAATSHDALLMDFERPGTYEVTATDGTNSATASIEVFS